MPDTIHSEEFDVILGRNPSWLLRWGITIIIGVIILMVIGCCYIKYPQVVRGDVTLTSENPPYDLAVRYNGILETVFVANDDVVNKGDLVAIVSTSSDYNDILYSSSLIENIITDTTLIDSILLAKELHLGDLQESWIELQRLCQDFINYMDIGYINQKIQLLLNQSATLSSYYDKLLEQRGSIVDELALEKASFKRDSLLLVKHVISQAEYENSLKKYISEKSNIAKFDAELINVQLNILQNEQQIIELQAQQKTEVSELLSAIFQQVDSYKGSIAKWEEQYAIVSPCNGKMSMQNITGKGQYVSAGDIIASVVPLDKSSIIGRLKVTSVNFGKIDIGQKVNVQLNGFPYLDYGVIKATVSSISPVPEKNNNGLYYTITISLDNGLITTYKKNLPFIQQMDGTAEIIVEDRCLISQFIDPIRSLLFNN